MVEKKAKQVRMDFIAAIAAKRAEAEKAKVKKNLKKSKK